MEAVQEIPQLKRLNSLECCCEKNSLKTSKKEVYTVCDLCSEKKFLKKLSSPRIVPDKNSFGE